LVSVIEYMSVIVSVSSTYKPAQPSTGSSIVPEHVISSPSPRATACVGSGNQEDEVEYNPDGYGPSLLPLIPIVGVKLLRKPEQEVEWIEVRFYALCQRLAAYKPRHNVQGELYRLL